MKYLRVILIVLLVVCCTLWVASYWWITWSSSDGLYIMKNHGGGFTINRYEYDTKRYSRLTYGRRFYLQTRWWPVIWVYNDTGRSPYLWSINGTYWLPTLLLGLPLAISASPWARRRRRAKQGLCIRCGYHLSGTYHIFCPECGAEVVKT